MGGGLLYNHKGEGTSRWPTQSDELDDYKIINWTHSMKMTQLLGQTGTHKRDTTQQIIYSVITADPPKNNLKK